MTSLPCRSKVQEFRALRGLAALLALLASCHSSWVALLLDSKEVVQGSTGSGTVLFLYLIFHKSVFSPTSSLELRHRLPCFAGTRGMTFLSTHSSRRGLVVAYQHKKQQSDSGFVRQLVSVRMSLRFSILGATASHHRYTLAILSRKFDPPKKQTFENSNIHLQRTHTSQCGLSVLKSVLSWAVFYHQ